MGFLGRPFHTSTFENIDTVFVFFTVAESPWKTIQYKHSSEPRTSLSWPSDCAYSGRCQFSVVAFNYKSISYPSPPSEFISEYQVMSSCSNVNLNVWRTLQTYKTLHVSDTNTCTVYSVIFAPCSFRPFTLANKFALFWIHLYIVVFKKI